LTKILGTTRVKVQFFREHIIITKCYKRKYTWYMWTSTKNRIPEPMISWHVKKKVI